jgi:hypothetical protein
VALLPGSVQEAAQRTEWVSLEPQLLPDPFEGDLTPWLLRRLELASSLATQIAQVRTEDA